MSDANKSKDSFSEEKHTEKTSRKSIKPLIVSSILVIVLAAAGVSYYFYNQYQQVKSQIHSPALSQQNEAGQLMQEVGKLMVLPQNEVPQIATVTDIAKLENLAFFKNAQNGDKVLIYPDEKEAILYDPTQNKIVSVGPISLNQTTPVPQQVAGAAITPTPVTVAIYNGTTVVGYARNIEEQLESKLKWITVTQTVNAAKNTYSQTEVVDLSGSDTAQAGQIASQLHGIVTSLPGGEERPENTDILVILGK